MGRPSKYVSVYCNQVVDHMVDGASLTSFAAEIGVARSTINDWMAEHAEFAEACARAKAKAAAWWEARGRSFVVDEGTSSALANFIQFGMKNMGAEDWKDKQLVGSDPENPLPSGVQVTFKGVNDAK